MEIPLSLKYIAMERSMDVYISVYVTQIERKLWTFLLNVLFDIIWALVELSMNVQVDAQRT